MLSRANCRSGGNSNEPGLDRRHLHRCQACEGGSWTCSRGRNIIKSAEPYTSAKGPGSMSNNGSRTFLRTREHRGHARVTSSCSSISSLCSRLRSSRTSCSRTSRSSARSAPVCFSRRLVGLDLHLLGHQLARSRAHAGSAAPVCPHARGACALDLDPGRLRRGASPSQPPMPSCKSGVPCS